MKHSHRFTLSFLILIAFLGTAISGCGGNPHELVMAPMDGMSERVQAAPVRVQEAYQFAVANPDVLQQIPCYCGCGAMGHTSNYSCYVADAGADGSITYDEHALDCGICVDISHDVKRLLAQGKSVAEIYTYIDGTYARFGPATPLN